VRPAPDHARPIAISRRERERDRERRRQRERIARRVCGHDRGALAKTLPEAKIFDITRRMRGRDGQPAAEFQPVRATPLVESVGTQVPFWTYDFAVKKPTRITATLRVITDHAKWWVQNDVQFDLEQIRAERHRVRDEDLSHRPKLYGEEWTPGVDSDPHINILLARIPARRRATSARRTSSRFG
jgi:hypothetical protein